MIFNSDKYLADFKKVHHRYEVYAYSIFKSALDSQVKAVSSHVKAYGGISESLANMLITKEPIEKAYKQVYINVGTLHAGRTLNQINALGKSFSKKSLPKLFSENWRRLMELFFTNHSASRVSDVTETTREGVRKVLADSEGLPMSQRATYITDTLDSLDFNRNRSMVIARTESTSAANYGASLGNADADYQTNKRWLSVLDANTRPDHVDANGQIVGNDESFIVGGYECQFPGDLSLPAKEVVNCRCAVAYVPIIENGLPVMRLAA